MITRDSILRAIENGISASQIVEYLVTHAHPQARHSHPPVPGSKKKILGKFLENFRNCNGETVTDQIRLWESEKKCFQAVTGVLFDK